MAGRRRSLSNLGGRTRFRQASCMRVGMYSGMMYTDTRPGEAQSLLGCGRGLASASECRWSERGWVAASQSGTGSTPPFAGAGWA